MRQNKVASKTFKKLQEDVATLEERKACLTTKMMQLLKNNKQMLKAERDKEAEIKALKKKLGQVQKELKKAKLKVG